MIRLWRDTAGSVLVEYTIVFPIFLLTMLGTLDAAHMLFQWAQANKAAYIGARTAIVSNPVAQSITSDSALYSSAQLPQDLGQFCYNLNNGNAAVDGSGNAYCPSVTVSCTSTACNPNAYGFNSAAFTNSYGTGIFDRMKAVLPQLQPSEVQITYQLNGGGYVGRPGGLDMNVTVKIHNFKVRLYFLPGLTAGLFPSQIIIPSFATTLTSEDMCSGTLPNCDLSGQHT